MHPRDFTTRLYRFLVGHPAQRLTRMRLEELEDRTTPTAAINLLASSFDVPAGLSELVPLSLVTPSSPGTAVQYTAQSSNSQVTTQVLTSTETWDLTVSGKDVNGNTFTGDLEIQLFPDESPLAVQQIVSLTNSGFYNGLTFERVLQGFVAQGGGPAGNLAYTSGLPNVPGQFNADQTFNSPGVVAFANAGPDTNNSQFFITSEGLQLSQEPQYLNFRYPIFGQLVSGFTTFNDIMGTPVGNNSSINEVSEPLTNVVITKAQIIDDPSTAVVRISAAAGFQGTATIDVSADDGSGPATASFGINYVASTTNNPAFLGAVVNQTTFANTPITFQLPATDVEGDQLTYVVTDPNNFGVNTPPPDVSVNINQATGQVTVTPDAGFTGTVNMMVGVEDQTARNNEPLSDQSQFDTHVITLTVLANNNDGSQVPLINPISLPTVADGTQLSFTAYAEAPTIGGVAVPLTYSLGSGAPAGVAINSQTGQVTWTPSQANDQTPGAYNVTVVATETNAPTISGTQTFAITVGQTAVQQGSGIAARTTVADGLTQSAEYYTNFITAAYNKYLGRGPDPSGLKYWVTLMQNGLSDEQLEAGFIGSTEFINDNGGVNGVANQAWIQGLYQTLLGRTPMASEVQYWVTQLNNNVSPQQIALDFTTSQERETERVQADYQQYLGRSATTTEVSYWVNVFLHGGSNEQVDAGFLASNEYFQAHGDNIVDWLYASYRATLQREPDSGGFQYWLGQL